MFPYGYLAIGIAVLLAIAGAGVKGYSLGADSVRVQWQAQAMKDATEHAAAVQAVQDKYRAAERASALKAASASKKYQVELANAETAKIIALDSLRSGTLRLRDPAAVVQACGSGTAETGSGTVRSDGRAAGELSPALAGFLVGLAAECDAVAGQLAGAQALIRADRE